MFRRGRLLLLIAQTLARKYTKALGFGFICGLTISLFFWKVAPIFHSQLLIPEKRIGLVGEYTPASLPQSIQETISAGLTHITQDGAVEGALAQSWEATDSGKTFIFTLRSDAIWHNGKKVESNDINYNIGGVEFIPIDTHTIQATLKSPYSPFPAVVSKPLFLRGLTGWGDAKVTSIDLNGNKVTSLQVTPISSSVNHTINYYFYNTEAAAITAFKLGEIDKIEELSQIEDIANWKGLSIKKNVNYHRIVAIYFNMNDPQLTEKDIRHGLGYGIQLPDDVERAISPISKTSWAYTDKIKKFTYDEKEAKNLLKEVKMSSDSAALTISTFAPYLTLAQTIKESWTKLGIPTDIRVVAAVPDDYQVLLTAQDVPPDPDQYPFWHSTQTTTNITRYVNVKIDKLLEDGRQEFDTSARKLIYADFQRRLVEDSPAIFLYYATSYTIERSP